MMIKSIRKKYFQYNGQAPMVFVLLTTFWGKCPYMCLATAAYFKNVSIFSANCVGALTTLTHNSVFGSCLLATLYVQLLLLSFWVSVCEPEVIHFSWWVLPVHLDRDFCLAKNLDTINSRDIWEGYKWWTTRWMWMYRREPQTGKAAYNFPVTTSICPALLPHVLGQKDESLPPTNVTFLG